MPHIRHSYAIVFWSLYSILTVLWIYDRFHWQIWPRQSFKNKFKVWFPNSTYGTGNDPFPLREGPWTVKTFDVLARIGARYSIIAAVAFSGPHCVEC